jgi:hypothetical protein
MAYESEMYIDETALDVELLEQPSLMMKYSRKLAEAKRDRDLAKENLEMLKAEISLDVRDNPTSYDLEKVTDKVVEACVLADDGYKTAQKEFNDANFEVNLLQGVISAIDHRRSALENLVKLYGQEYFAGPKIPHDLGQLRKEKNAEVEHRIGKSFRRTNKSKSNGKEKEN